MIETEEITEVTERRTFLNGKFVGKFVGELNLAKSDLNHERFYDIEVLEGEIFALKGDIRKWQEGDENPVFLTAEPFPSKLPEKLRCRIEYPDKTFKWFTIELHQAKLLDYKLYNQHYEGDTLFGTIEGDISGFLLHYDISTVTRPKQVEEEQAVELETTEQLSAPELTNLQAGEKQYTGVYERLPVYDKQGNRAYTKWEYTGSTKKTSFWEYAGLFIQWLVLPLLLIPLLIYGWRFIVPLAIVYGALYFLSAITPVVRIVLGWIFRVVTVILGFLFVAGICNLIGIKKERLTQSTAKDEVNEVSRTKKPKTLYNDSIISHHRVWRNYEDKEYSGDLEVLSSCVGLASQFRNGNANGLSTLSDYSALISSLEAFDREGLRRVYNLFDSIRNKENLDDMAFAEVIVSCIQDIPYTMLLDDDCNPKLYDDAYINKYLRNGGECEGYVKYGLYGPLEFIGNLKGDCDTRSLLLFSILDHFGFDAAILASDMYKHAVIGVNLPYQGIYKMANGKRYTVWETTAKGVQPGLFPKEISDMRYWNVVLLTQSNQLL